jgi:TnpA family transposase
MLSGVKTHSKVIQQSTRYSSKLVETTERILVMVSTSAIVKAIQLTPILQYLKINAMSLLFGATALLKIAKYLWYGYGSK